MGSVSSALTGLAVPAVRVPGGVFAVRDRYDTAFGDVLLAVLTPTGTRPFDRSFGSRLNRCLFTTTLPADEGTISFIVEETVSRSCPNITVESARVVSYPAQDMFYLSVDFSIAGDASPTSYGAYLASSDILMSVNNPSNTLTQ